MILIYMLVYNEARFVKQAIDSVLNQTHKDFFLLISDNHSNDGSSELIENAVLSDKRVHKVSPPSHMASLDHLRYVWNELLPRYTDNTHTIFIGGHDLWERNLLDRLYKRALLEPDASIIFPSTAQIDLDGNINFELVNQVQVKFQNKSIVPHYVLLGSTTNQVWGGLWEEARRRKVSLRHECSGADLLMVAENALYGDLLLEPGAKLYLRLAPNYQEGWAGYRKKHLSKEIRQDSCIDFFYQLEWLSWIADKASEEDVFCRQDLIKPMYKASLISAYICKYVTHLIDEDGGLTNYFKFFNNPEIRKFLDAQGVSSSLVENLIKNSL